MTLELTQAGVSHGLLRPGNWVDVVLTNESYAESGSTPKYAATTVLEGVRLLAIGAVVTEFIAKQPVENVGNPNSYEPVRVTFEVSPSDAKHLLLAQRLGCFRSSYVANLRLIWQRWKRGQYCGMSKCLKALIQEVSPKHCAYFRW